MVMREESLAILEVGLAISAAVLRRKQVNFRQPQPLTI